MIAAAGATGKLGTSPRELLQQGAKRLAESPELTKITESIRGELLDAAKTAAVTAASSRLDSLNQRLQDQTGAGKSGGDEKESEGDEDYLDVEPEDEQSEDSQTGEDTGGSDDTEESEQAASSSNDSEDSDDSEDTDEEPEEEPEPPRRRRAAQTRSARSTSTRSASRSRSGRTPARGSEGRAPVRRTRR
ncbi:hypothetical protein ACFSVJ_00100 [Prauserella oleivorans]